MICQQDEWTDNNAHSDYILEEIDPCEFRADYEVISLEKCVEDCRKDHWFDHIWESNWKTDSYFFTEFLKATAGKGAGNEKDQQIYDHDHNEREQNWSHVFIIVHTIVIKYGFSRAFWV